MEQNGKDHGVTSKLFCFRHSLFLNSLPNDQILDLSKLKTFADNKINVDFKKKFALGRVENIVDRGENAGYHHFHLFPQCF